MKHIKQTIAGSKMILSCEKCNETTVIEIKSRDYLEKSLAAFKKHHEHKNTD